MNHWNVAASVWCVDVYGTVCLIPLGSEFVVYPRYGIARKKSLRRNAGKTVFQWFRVTPGRFSDWGKVGVAGFRYQDEVTKTDAGTGRIFGRESKRGKD